MNGYIHTGYQHFYLVESERTPSTKADYSITIHDEVQSRVLEEASSYISE